jgi:hypothetical protein
MGFCYWILNNGTVVEPSHNHILSVVENPILFGETPESIKATFEKHGESCNYNVESKAREEILTRVIILRNHVRIRKNQSKKQQYWSLQLHDLTEERERSILAWARNVIRDADDKFGDVIINQLKDNSYIRTSLNLLAVEIPGDEKKCQK